MIDEISAKTIIMMLEDNGGALRVFSLLIKAGEERYIKNLFTLGITGEMIGVCYDKICNSNLDLFKAKIDDGSILSYLKKTKDYYYYNNPPF